VLLYNLNQE